MQVVIVRHLANFVQFRRVAALIRDPSTRKELARGVTDAGRKTRTQVQKAVAKQMAVTAGGYQGYVVPNMRGISSEANLSFTIRATGKGSKITTYKGLRAMSPKGRAAKALNQGRNRMDFGYVRSAVWNNPRAFQRSFEQGGMYLALIPAANGSSRLPKALWTFGKKPYQPRSADGRFAAGGRQGFKVRRLFGPALGKELDKDQSLNVFLTYGPAELDRQISKRVAKFMRF